ncbi:KpsF/GutQ family sugar-phosphate isomerase [Oligella urethralis]|uniref:KpsF/GutQ family sugar-phosphate isomerase n=1 Tax=Oligella urethralis TaxID=90245 RepID=UPI0025514E1A|nr:KpsF/GutQ family sugar-phosphate isomerase [Oligella urethralis]MDK6202918.1 KpsF/GutQ family sugar-phosphate isomerase [Oligella urethralis]
MIKKVDFAEKIEQFAINYAQEVVATEIAELQRLSSRLGDQFQKAVELILNCSGRVAVVGMGKSGIIGKKITATMSSTGTPAFFVHPAEAFHGDLGMIQPIDVLLLISNSGETEELIRLLPFLGENKVIGMTGNVNSTLAKVSDAVLDISVVREACHNNLAPTSSTTNTLVMGDALAIAVSRISAFEPKDFARYHPGGSLGRRLLTRVADVMISDNLPFCKSTDVLKEVVKSISAGRIGIVLVVDDGALVGLITDGDIRRALDAYEDPLSLRASEIMSTNPRTISAHRMLAEAEDRMRDLRINSLVVVDSDSSTKVLGVIQIWT